VEALRSTTTNGMTSKGFLIEQTRELGWMESRAYAATAREAAPDGVIAPLATRGIELPSDTGERLPGLTVAAVGPIASNIVPTCHPRQVMSVVGSREPPIRGSRSPAVRQGRGALSNPQQIRWRSWPDKMAVGPFPKITPLPTRVNDGTSVSQYHFAPCQRGSEVDYYVLDGMGHSWPPSSATQAT
jgi:hypothetical protein